MKIVRVIFLTAMLIAGTGAEAQKYYTGLLRDDKGAEKIPQKPQLLTRDFTVLPKSYSLKKYCPTPKSQGQHGTCTSWATTYAARTICEAINNGWTDRETIDREAFAPIFVYAQIKQAGDSDCLHGSYVSDAFNLLHEKGAPKYTHFETQCAERVPEELFGEARDYAVDDFFKLFAANDTYQKKVQTTKKALSENKPVVVCMGVYESFFDTKEVWNGLRKEGEAPGYHAMCVVAYDDEKEGGAFQLMNSWNTGWGDGGFAWVTYKDYCDNADHAYEMYVKPKAQPQPQPKPVDGERPTLEWLNREMKVTSKDYTVRVGVKSKSEVLDKKVTVNGQAFRGVVPVSNDGYDMTINQKVTLVEGENVIRVEVKNAHGVTTAERTVTYASAEKRYALSGSMYFQLATGERMATRLQTGSGIPFYKVEEGYISGTRYRMYLSNDEPAYVYIIGSDLTNSVSKVFPPNNLVSPALVYKSNNIAIPDEKWFIEMDNTVGKDYLCVLYAESALPIDEIVEKIRNAAGTFAEKVKKVLGEECVPIADMKLEAQKIQFEAKSNQRVVPVVVEITHLP